MHVLEFRSPGECKEETSLLESFRPTGTSRHCSPPRRTTDVGAMVLVPEKIPEDWRGVHPSAHLPVLAQRQAATTHSAGV